MRYPTVALVFACAFVIGTSASPAGADPAPLPPAPPYVPGDVAPEPGSFSYPYNVIVVPAPAANDARGVYVGTNAGPGQSLSGLPGSQLGNSPAPPNSLTNSSVLSGIEAGAAQAPAPSGGVSVGAGNQTPALEDPAGQPPSAAAIPEAEAPTTAARDPAPILESPDGTPPNS